MFLVFLYSYHRTYLQIIVNLYLKSISFFNWMPVEKNAENIYFAKQRTWFYAANKLSHISWPFCFMARLSSRTMSGYFWKTWDQTLTAEFNFWVVIYYARRAAKYGLIDFKTCYSRMHVNSTQPQWHKCSRKQIARYRFIYLVIDIKYFVSKACVYKGT